MLRVASLALGSGLRLSYAERGAGSGPAVVMVPGPTDAWRSYQRVLQRLPRGIRAIAVSLRGHGDSDKPDDGYTVRDFADDVVAVLDAMEIDQSVLVGHSGSCFVTRRVALEHPERVAGLVCEASPTSLGADDGLREFVHSEVLSLADPIDPDFARSLVTDTSSELVTPELLDVLVEDVLKVPARVWRALFSNLLEYDDMSELGRIAAPTLLLWGDGDPIVSREMQDALTECIPASTLTVYPGARHTPRWEDPERFAADLAAFVGGLPGGA